MFYAKRSTASAPLPPLYVLKQRIRGMPYYRDDRLNTLATLLLLFPSADHPLRLVPKALAPKIHVHGEQDLGAMGTTL